MPKQIKTRQHAPYGRVLVAALVVVAVMSIVRACVPGPPPQALSGASPEIDAAFQRGLKQKEAEPQSIKERMYCNPIGEIQVRKGKTS